MFLIIEHPLVSSVHSVLLCHATRQTYTRTPERLTCNTASVSLSFLCICSTFQTQNHCQYQSTCTVRRLDNLTTCKQRNHSQFNTHASIHLVQICSLHCELNEHFLYNQICQKLPVSCANCQVLLAFAILFCYFVLWVSFDFTTIPNPGENFLLKVAMLSINSNLIATGQTLAGNDCSTSFFTCLSRNGSISLCNCRKPVLSLVECHSSKSSHQSNLPWM